MQDDTHFPLVEVSGSPYERGRQHGLAVPQRVRRSVDIYAQALSELAFSQAALSRLIDEFTQAIVAFEPAYVEEMRGIADGAGVSYEQVLMINARTEIMARARAHGNQADQAGDTASEDECTGVAVLPQRSATGAYIQGQNWDNRIDCAETVIILRVLREDGPDVLTFVEAGGLARYGVNSAGIVLTGNGMSSSRDYQQPGVPLPLVRRKALEQTHFAIALQLVMTTPKACSCNVILGTSDGFGVSVECAPDESFLRYPIDGVVVHANHWTSPVALKKLVDVSLAGSPESQFRHARVQALIDGMPKVSMEDLKTVFADTAGTPFSVCRPARTSGQGYPSCTTATLLVDPAAGSMSVARLPWQGGTYAHYSVARGSEINSHLNNVEETT